MSGNGHPSREDTQTRVRLQVESERQKWVRDVRRQVLAVAGTFAALSILVVVVIFVAGRASADDFKEQDKRVSVVESVQRTQEKKLDRFEQKIDWLIEQSVTTARQVGAPALPAPPPKHAEP